MMEGPSADSEEKHEPMSDIDTAAADSLKVLDPKRPIREADIPRRRPNVRLGPEAEIPRCNRHVRSPKVDIGSFTRHFVGGWLH